MYIIQAFGSPFFPGSSFGPFLFCDLDLCRGLTTDGLTNFNDGVYCA